MTNHANKAGDLTTGDEFATPRSNTSDESRWKEKLNSRVDEFVTEVACEIVEEELEKQKTELSAEHKQEIANLNASHDVRVGLATLAMSQLWEPRVAALTKENALLKDAYNELQDEIAQTRTQHVQELANVRDDERQKIADALVVRRDVGSTHTALKRFLGEVSSVPIFGPTLLSIIVSFCIMFGSQTALLRHKQMLGFLHVNELGFGVGLIMLLIAVLIVVHAGRRAREARENALKDNLETLRAEIAEHADARKRRRS